MKPSKRRYLADKEKKAEFARYEMPILIHASDCPMIISKDAADAIIKAQAQAIADWVDNEVLCDVLGIK